jgi:hypothetical protein
MDVDVDREKFVDYVIQVYRENFLTLGFLPKHNFYDYFDKNRFYILDDWSFILIGSLRSKYTPIYAVYVNPKSRNKGVETVKKLIDSIPKNHGYRVRCVNGFGFWTKIGLEKVAVDKTNTRKRDVHIYQGLIN